MFILPMIMVISISFSSEQAVMSAGGGFSLLPKDFTLDAYRLVFANMEQMATAYIVTASQAFLGTFLSLIVMGMVGYALSRSNFAYKKPITFFIFFTMLFSGGLIPTYIVYTRWFGLADSFWVYILPGLSGGAWYTLIIRTFFKSIPESLFESARIDGAGELGIFFRIAVPLSKPVFATLGFMMIVVKWNDWFTSLVYIRSHNLYTLQFLLQRVLNQAAFVNAMITNPPAGISVQDFQTSLPLETLKFALCVIAAGPMLIIFPFFQKYFATGLTIGAIKG